MTMRTSPLSTLLQGYTATWIDVAGMALPAAFAAADTGYDTANDLALCDVSGFRRFVLKGKDAAAHLREMGLTLPEKINGVVEIDGGGLVIRTGGAEWLVEEPPCLPPTSGPIMGEERPPAPPILGEDLAGQGGSLWLYPAPGASFLLSGARAPCVLLETCNVDLRSPDGDLVMTRVAGVSCYILHRTLNGIPAYQFWTDASYAHYLGETLLAIIHEYNGGVAGVSCYFPEVLLPQT